MRDQGRASQLQWAAGLSQRWNGRDLQARRDGRDGEIVLGLQGLSRTLRRRCVLHGLIVENEKVQGKWHLLSNIDQY